MKREELQNHLKEETRCVHASSALKQRALHAALEKERRHPMKKGIGIVLFALITLMLCTIAMAASRWGIFDFVSQYNRESIPEDMLEYVQTQVMAAENDLITATIEELYYDGRTARMTLQITPKSADTLLLGDYVNLNTPFIHQMTESLPETNDNTQTFFDVIENNHYAHGYVISASLNGGAWLSASHDFILGDDGSLTIFIQNEFEDDLAERPCTLRLTLTPYEEPLTPSSIAQDEKREILEQPLTLTAAVSDQAADDGAVSTYISESPVLYESIGVQIDRLTLEIKPLEIYAKIEYSVTDPAAYAETDGGLWFEFIDPQIEGDPYDQRLTPGLTGSGTVLPVDGDLENAQHYVQYETLSKSELHDAYVLRAYNAWSKERYDTHEIQVQPGD